MAFVSGLASSDVTDSVITSLSTELTAKLLLVDDAITDMAESKGVLEDDIEESPVHYLVKKWGVFWMCSEICLDAMGRNKIEVLDLEKYKIKYDIYKKLLKETEEKISPSVLTGLPVDERDRATIMTGTIFRG